MGVPHSITVVVLLGVCIHPFWLSVFTDFEKGLSLFLREESWFAGGSAVFEFRSREELTGESLEVTQWSITTEKRTG